MARFKDEMNNVYGRLTVIDMGKVRRKAISWVCLCSCGNITTVLGVDLRRGHVQSCGCLHKEIAARNTFGNASIIDLRTKHELYATWKGMLERCYNKNHKAYKYYGGKGIIVCERWKNDFWVFANDVGKRPKNHSLDRKDGNKNYEPDNCKWSTYREQTLNRSK